MKNIMEVLENIKNKTTIYHIDPILWRGLYNKELKAVTFKGLFYNNIHSSIIHRGQTVETILVSIKG
jgi:hypothetical protein